MSQLTASAPILASTPIATATLTLIPATTTTTTTTTPATCTGTRALVHTPTSYSV